MSGNTAANTGGGVDNRAGATLTLQGTTVSGNSATTGAGAGIINGSGGVLELGYSTVTGNVAGGCGGGIANHGALTIRGSTLAANSSVVRRRAREQPGRLRR